MTSQMRAQVMACRGEIRHAEVDAVAAAIDAAVKEEREALYPLADFVIAKRNSPEPAAWTIPTHHVVFDALVAIRSRGPAPERPKSGRCVDCPLPLHEGPCAPVDPAETLCEECGFTRGEAHFPRCPDRPVDPVREAGRRLVVRRPPPFRTGYDKHTFELWQALAAALEADHG